MNVEGESPEGTSLPPTQPLSTFHLGRGSPPRASPTFPPRLPLKPALPLCIRGHR